MSEPRDAMRETPALPSLGGSAPTPITDDPELDGTDGAHPAWWRGNDRGVEAACDRVAEVLDGAPAPFHFGSAKLTEVATRVAHLRAPDAVLRAAAEKLNAAAIEVVNRYIGGSPIGGKRFDAAIDALGAAQIDMGITLRRATLPSEGARPGDDELELAWGIIANAGGGDWTKESPEWQEAAARWRDRVMPGLSAGARP